jgi:hypothetical protein
MAGASRPPVLLERPLAEAATRQCSARYIGARRAKAKGVFEAQQGVAGV